MTQQAFRFADFESRDLRVSAVQPGKITRLGELPLISYTFDVDGKPEQFFYDITIKEGGRGFWNGPNGFRTIARDMLEGIESLGAGVWYNMSAYYNGDEQLFLMQTLSNLLRKKQSASMYPRGESQGGGVVHGAGHIVVPLEQGATLRIMHRGSDQLSQMQAMGPFNRWDIVLRGSMAFFGQRVDYTVHHAHAQGFEFANLTEIAASMQWTMLQWFPFMEGHICIDRIQTMTNPVSHQTEEAKERNGRG